MSKDSHDKEPQHRKRWEGCPIEEHYFGEERKSGKVARKKASATDRSKYKKTDQDQLKKRILPAKKENENLLLGRILTIASQGISVSHEKTLYNCTLRGLLKKDKSLFKNLVTVGDWVRFEPTSKGEGLIDSIEPRKSTLSRADNLSRRKEQLIASNIDQVLITMSVVSPPLKPFLVDRYIIATLKGNMKPIILINKIDLLQSASDKTLVTQESELYHEFLKAYPAAGIPVLGVSSVTGEGMDALRELMKNQSSVFSGQSGVGKSSLITAVTGIDLRVGPIVEKTQKGTHTTTTTQLLPLPFGGWCIDTPGIKSFGVWDLKPDEIAPYFKEIFAIGRMCKFPDCIHLHEEGCAVIEALERGEISFLRYQSYQYLLDSVNKEHLRR